MNFKMFEADVRILDRQSGRKIREKYIEHFVNTEHTNYKQQIQIRHQFIDGYCYLGYLWDFIKNPIVIEENYFETIAERISDIYVFWDIHSCERILIKDYWKFDKEAVLELKYRHLLEGKEFLPEDIYIFDSSLTWTLIKTHEEINGKRYCLKTGKI